MTRAAGALTSNELGRKADVGTARGLDGELEAGERVLEVALERVHHQRELAVELQRGHARQVVDGRLQQGNMCQRSQAHQLMERHARVRSSWHSSRATMLLPLGS